MRYLAGRALGAAVIGVAITTAHAGLSLLNPSGPGITVIQATQPGGDALDCVDAACASGPVAAAIDAALQSANITVARLFDILNEKVIASTAGGQIPYIQASTAIDVPLAGEAGRSFALVIGNGQYPHLTPLQGAPRDAKLVGAALQRIGFQAEIVVDADVGQMTKAIAGFFDKLKDGDVALLYYSGHGFSAKGAGYIPPLDGKTEDIEALVKASTSVTSLIEGLSRSKAGRRVLILDTHYPTVDPQTTR